VFPRCPDVRPYDVIRTFASVALAGIASLEFISGMIGHTKPETTERYAHLARAADPMRKVGQKFALKVAKALEQRARE
jgi:site-specific recombinase XerD